MNLLLENSIVLNFSALDCHNDRIKGDCIIYVKLGNAFLYHHLSFVFISPDLCTPSCTCPKFNVVGDLNEVIFRFIMNPSDLILRL